MWGRGGVIIRCLPWSMTLHLFESEHRFYWTPKDIRVLVFLFAHLSPVPGWCSVAAIFISCGLHVLVLFILRGRFCFFRVCTVPVTPPLRVLPHDEYPFAYRLSCQPHLVP
ncbi:unnamed protein product, partial [Ectocarpus sp. 12 AP-2014]